MRAKKWLLLLALIFSLLPLTFAPSPPKAEAQALKGASANFEWNGFSVTIISSWELIQNETDYNGDGVPDVISTVTFFNDTLMEIYVDDTRETGAYKWACAVINITGFDKVGKWEYNPATDVWTYTGLLNYGYLPYYGLPYEWANETDGYGFIVFGAGSGDKWYRLNFTVGYKEFKIYTGKGSEVISVKPKKIKYSNNKGFHSLDVEIKALKPELTLYRWNREAFIDLQLPNAISKGRSVSGGKLTQKYDGFDAVYYPRNDIGEYGSFEFELVLKNKPAFNQFTFNLNFTNLKFYYQPPLYEEYGFSEPFSNSTFFVNATHVMEYINGTWITTTYRPENVVRSYAVYHAYKMNNEYKTGKAFHIYRPKAVDSAGNTTWCDLSIDEAKGLLTVTIPQEFLDKAVYPVTIDPTFGYETVGGSAQAIYNRISGSVFTCPEPGTADSLTAYVEATGFMPSKSKYAIYLHSDSSLVGSTEEQTLSPPVSGWYTLSLAGQSLDATDYVLVAWSNLPASGHCQLLYYDTGDTDQGHYQELTYNDFPDPATFSHEDRKYSIYCTYTPSNQNPSIGEFQAPSTVYANQYFFLNATINDPDGVADFVNATVEISNSIILKWDSATDTFSEYQDTNNYCTLDVSSSFKTSVNSTAYKLSFKIKLTWSFPEGYVSIIATNTLVYDSQGISGSNSQTNLFYFEDDLIISSASVDDSRINPSQTITFTGTIYYEGTTTPPEDTSGITAKVELSGVVKGSTTTIDANGDFSITISGESAVNSYSYNIYAVTDENTVQNQTVTVIVDRIKITDGGVSDDRCDLGSTQTVWFTAVYEYDSATFDGSKGTLYVNGSAMTWDSVDSRWEITYSYSTIGKRTFLVSEVSDSTYGLTTINDVAGAKEIIWDRIQISLSISDNRIDVGSAMSWSFTATYEYDSSDASPYVSVTLNDTTTKNSVGLWHFTVSSITESQYGLSVFSSNTISCIWDKVQFTLTVSDNRIDVGTTASISVSGVYAYDNSAFSGTYSLNDTLTKNVVGKYYYTIDSMTDNNYGLTVFESNVVYVIFDRVQISLSISDSRIDVGSAMQWSFTAVYEYDGAAATSYVTVNLNDTTTKNSVGKWVFTVQSISESQYGLSTFTSNTIECIWDKLQLTLTVADNRINIGETASISVSGVYAYDNSAFSGSCSLNDTLTKSTAGKYGFKISSITDNLYGLTAFDTNEVYVIWDGLKIVNLQTVEYLGNGKYRYTAQIVYAYDNSAISQATVAVALPNGTEIGQTSSNVTGWFSFVLSQTNASQSGAYTLYGVNDNNYGITYRVQDQTFNLYAWTLQTVDTDGNSLSDTTISITSSSQPVWSGNPATLRIPSGTYSITVTWLQGLIVNQTSISISADKSSSLTCKCYPFSLNNQIWHVASNATISSVTFISRNLTIQFSDSVDNYILVVDCTQKPTYIYNYTYTLSSIFNNYLVIPHHANFTFQIIYKDWGIHIAETSGGRITDMNLEGQILTITSQGETGQVATLKLYCGPKGNPAETEGFTTATYSSSTKILTGTYTFASQKILKIKWQISGGGGGGGSSGTATLGPLIVTVKTILASPIQAGTATTAKIEIRWSGQTTIMIENIEFKEHADWFKPPAMPIKIIMSPGQDQGIYTLSVEVNVPVEAEPGQYNIPCEITIATPQGAETVVSSYATFTVTGATYGVPDIMTYVFLGMIGLIVVGAAFRETRKRKYYK